MDALKKYRREKINFKTPGGVKSELIFVLAGSDERKRLLAKAEARAKEMKWKVLWKDFF